MRAASGEAGREYSRPLALNRTGPVSRAVGRFSLSRAMARASDCNQRSQHMNCLVCGAKAELIDVTIDGVSIACPGAANTMYQVRLLVRDKWRHLD